MLEVGQVWSVKGMAPGVRFGIFRIEPPRHGIGGAGRVVHGSISGFGSVNAGGISLTPDGGHLPFDEAAVLGSVLELTAEGAAPPAGFEEGYADWREGGGGAFTMPIAQAIAVLFGAP